MSTVAHQPVPITREGFARLQAELEQLVSARRRAVDLDDQAALERRVYELEATIALARIAEPPADGVAGIGQRVEIRLRPGAAPVEYHLVGAPEADPAAGRVSVVSPVGQALVGHRSGDRVTVDTPGGPRVVEIVAVG